MKIALIAVFLTIASATVGEIWIRTDPGVTVSLDGVVAGVSAADQGGLWLREVKPGPHELTLQIAGGNAKTMRVEVVGGQVTTVNISSLALRTARKSDRSGLEIRLQGQPANCFATLGARRDALTSAVTAIDGLEAGRHRLAISCGGRTLRKDVEAGAGRTVIVEADFAAGTLKVAGDRARVTQMEVKSSSQDKILEAKISPHAKRALSAAFGPGVEIVEVRVGTETIVRVVFEAADANAASSIVETLRNTPEVGEITVHSLRTVKNRVRVDLQVEFTR